MVNTFAIFAAGADQGREVAPHAASVMSPSLHEARSLGVAFVNGAPTRRSPMTAPLPAGLRATFPLPTPAFYSP